jgi:hypothetical protein
MSACARSQIIVGSGVKSRQAQLAWSARPTPKPDPFLAVYSPSPPVQS